LRPPIERIASLAGLDLDKFADNIESGVVSEPFKRFA
jgi:hypothetical protein